MKKLVFLIVAICMIAACGVTPTPTPVPLATTPVSSRGSVATVTPTQVVRRTCGAFMSYSTSDVLTMFGDNGTTYRLHFSVAPSDLVSRDRICFHNTDGAIIIERQ